MTTTRMPTLADVTNNKFLCPSFGFIEYKKGHNNYSFGYNKDKIWDELMKTTEVFFYNKNVRTHLIHPNQITTPLTIKDSTDYLEQYTKFAKLFNNLTPEDILEFVDLFDIKEMISYDIEYCRGNIVKNQSFITQLDDKCDTPNDKNFIFFRKQGGVDDFQRKQYLLADREISDLNIYQEIASLQHLKQIFFLDIGDKDDYVIFDIWGNSVNKNPYYMMRAPNCNKMVGGNTQVLVGTSKNNRTCELKFKVASSRKYNFIENMRQDGAKLLIFFDDGNYEKINIAIAASLEGNLKDNKHLKYLLKTTQKYLDFEQSIYLDEKTIWLE